MGGYGSGNWYRWNNKTTTEDVMQLDIRIMNRRGWLTPSNRRTIHWKWNGEPWGDISYLTYSNHLELSYRYRINSDDWHPVKQTINIEKTFCHYGRQRPWFLCPRCNRRCAILYNPGKLFLCRKCYQLPYQSQNQSR